METWFPFHLSFFKIQRASLLMDVVILVSEYFYYQKASICWSVCRSGYKRHICIFRETFIRPFNFSAHLYIHPTIRLVKMSFFFGLISFVHIPIIFDHLFYQNFVHQVDKIHNCNKEMLISWLLFKIKRFIW